MKRLALLSCILFAVCGFYAQKVVKSGEVINIDKVKYRITYTGKMVVDTLKNPYIYNESEMRLDIGEKVTHFYDRSKEVKDSILHIIFGIHKHGFITNSIVCHNLTITLILQQRLIRFQGRSMTYVSQIATQSYRLSTPRCKVCKDCKD